MKNNPRVCVTLTLGHGEQVERCIELERSLYNDAGQRLDFPYASPDGNLGMLFCTDPLTMKRVLCTRQELAEMISRAITEAMLDHLGVKDTKMDYSQEQWAKMQPEDVPVFLRKQAD